MEVKQTKTGYAENPYRWSSIANLPAEFNLAWKEKRENDMTCLASQRFDVYEKMDGTNLGIVAWPPHDAGQLLGRNYLIPHQERTYQKRSLDAVRSDETLHSARVVAENIIREMCGLSAEDVKTVVIYGELIIDGKRFGYEDRGVKAGDYFVFGVMVVCQDPRTASSLDSMLRLSKGFATKIKLHDGSAVQICLNSAFEEALSIVQQNIRGVNEEWASFPRVPLCLGRDQCFSQVLQLHAERLIEGCDTLEGVVLTQAGTTTVRHRDVIYKWKTGLTDESNSELHLTQMRDQFVQTPQMLEKYRMVYQSTCVFLDVYQKNPRVREQRKGGRVLHQANNNEKKGKDKSFKYDKHRLELLVNNELTKVDAGILHDKGVDAAARQLLASSVAQEAVNEYMHTNAEHGQHRRKNMLQDVATKLVWSLSKGNH